MVSRDVLQNSARLLEIFMSHTHVLFAVLSIAALGNLLQLPSVRGKAIHALINDHEIMKDFLSLDLLNVFRFAELIEFMRHKGDIEFKEFLNKIGVGNMD